jgi:predicted membrane-bound spermidine synthase
MGMTGDPIATAEERKVGSDRLVYILIYSNAFVLGAVVMGFEMLGSRYLNPYFGGSVNTWAAIISSVLMALMLGYYAGGWLADRAPSARVLGTCIFVGAVYLGMTPILADFFLERIWLQLGDGLPALLTASCLLFVVPVLFLGMYLPFSVRLVLRSVASTGRITGGLYAVSTLGSVFGTLLTTFVLIPAVGTRAITYIAAIVVVISALSLWTVKKTQP